MDKTNVVKLFKHSGVDSLKEAVSNYSVFSDDVLELTKTVDKPDEYYVEGDEITFTIKIKNNGDKKITNFILRDQVEEFIVPFDGGYKVLSNIGHVQSYFNPIVVENITLNPCEEMFVKITGKVTK